MTEAGASLVLFTMMRVEPICSVCSICTTLQGICGLREL